jgi:hypothetical protein
MRGMIFKRSYPGSWHGWVYRSAVCSIWKWFLGNLKNQGARHQMVDGFASPDDPRPEPTTGRHAAQYHMYSFTAGAHSSWCECETVSRSLVQGRSTLKQVTLLDDLNQEPGRTATAQV